MILSIDCSNENAFVCLSNDGEVVASKQSDNQKNHAGFLHVAIKTLMDELNINLNSLKGIAVVSGPGSYTGVRVAMATAKGLCLALKKPMFLLNGLELLALACYQQVKMDNSVYIPLIDARRMEVFTAAYNQKQQNLTPPGNHILNEDSFKNFLDVSTVCFTGNGIIKASSVISHPNAKFCETIDVVTAAAYLAETSFKSGLVADLKYSEPLYIKPFFEG